MPTEPTTTSQVHAYRFMLRRMQSALVRKDPVMLHDPMRTHIRASAVGVILGALGLAAFFVVGLFKPTSVIEVGDIVNVEDTPSVYVVVEGSTADQPLRLVPVLNVTSARLLYAALSPGAQPPPTKSVQESALVGIPQAPRIGLPDWPQTLPDPQRLADGAWSVCDTASSTSDSGDARSPAAVSTAAVLALPPGRMLAENEALLVEGPGGSDYLVWDGGRLPVDLGEPRVVRPAGLEGLSARPVSAGLLNAIRRGSRWPCRRSRVSVSRWICRSYPASASAMWCGSSSPGSRIHTSWCCGTGFNG